MPARDIFHQIVRNALIKDGWTITHDPFPLKIGKRDLSIDLGAEQLFAAELGEERIAIEVKSFLSESEVEDLRNALGQYTLYLDILAVVDPERLLYLAVREAVYRSLFDEPIGKILLHNHRLKLLVFDPQQEVIVEWIP